MWCGDLNLQGGYRFKWAKFSNLKLDKSTFTYNFYEMHDFNYMVRSKIDFRVKI